MADNLFSIDKAPKTIPVWETIIADLGNPEPQRVARALGVGRSTVYRWNATGQGPRIACLALFWLTRWGRSQVDTQATNDAMLFAALARAQGEELNKLRRQVQQIDHESRELAYELATLRLTHSARDNAATADPTRTGTAPGDSLEPSSPQAMAWPMLDPAQSWPPLADRPAYLLEHEALAGSPDSPATPPPAAHSTRCPTPGHTLPPQPSAPQESARLSPSDSPRLHNDAILASQEKGGVLLVGTKTSPAGRPALAVALRAYGPAPARLHFSASEPGQAHQAYGTAAFQGKGRTCGAHGPARPRDPVLRHQADPGSTGAAIDLHGKPARLSTAIQRSNHAPAEGQGAPPGEGVFTAIVTAATRQPTRQVNP